MVPDASIALIAVKGHNAHVAFVREQDVVLYGEHQRCFRAATVIIRRVDARGAFTPHAALE
jgi:hypothetical protein